MTSWACLVVSELKLIFHCVAQLLIYSRLLLRLFAEVFNVIYNRKQRSIICIKLGISWKAFCQIINVNQKQQRTEYGTLRYSSTEILPCRKLFLVCWNRSAAFTLICILIVHILVYMLIYTIMWYKNNSVSLLIYIWISNTFFYCERYSLIWKV